jgi:hypothetical protein
LTGLTGFDASLTDSNIQQGRRCKNGHALMGRSHRVRASSQPFRHPYFKDLLGFYTNGGKDFVSGKQKMTVFDLLWKSPSGCCNAEGTNMF